jgi:hypothetical protein
MPLSEKVKISPCSVTHPSTIHLSQESEMTSNKPRHQQDVDYFAFIGNEFYEWVGTAPTSNLVEAIREYFKVLEYSSKIVDEESDFADPKFLEDLNEIAWHFFELGPYIMEIQAQLNQRVSPKNPVPFRRAE